MLALGLAAFIALPAQAEKRVALVIGNTNYVHVPRLANPANDAKLMAETLTALGFALVGGGAQLDLDKPGLDRAVQSFGQELQGADVGLFYYAGHAVEVRRANYLVPVGANPVREADVDFQMLDANLVLRQMESAGAKLNLVILDACRNNPFGGRGLRSAGSGLAQMQAPEGTLISFATQPGNVALDGAQGNSPYTKALAETIRKPGLGLFDAFNAVGLAVKQATGGAQQPWVSSSPIAGQFYFAGGQVSTTAAKPDDVSLLQERLKALEEQLKKKDEPKVAVGVFPQQTAPAPTRQYKAGETFKDCDVCPEMVVVPAGSFMMGSPASEKGRNSSEGPQHRVTIRKPFAVGKFEVIFTEWDACVTDGGCNGYRPSDDLGQGRGTQPVVNVNWSDALTYISWLQRKTGQKYRMLSEAEWEYAARAGTRTGFSCGNKDSCIDQAAWYGANSDVHSHPVGQKSANAFGLYDVHGNVWEWTDDCYHGSYAGAPTDRLAWTSGDCDRRVLRGGSWFSDVGFVRSATRYDWYLMTTRERTIGFRVARTLD